MVVPAIENRIKSSVSPVTAMTVKVTTEPSAMVSARVIWTVTSVDEFAPRTTFVGDSSKSKKSLVPLLDITVVAVRLNKASGPLLVRVRITVAVSPGRKVIEPVKPSPVCSNYIVVV